MSSPPRPIYSRSGSRDDALPFREMFRHAPSAQAVSRLDNSQFVEVNEAFAKLLGYTPDELRGRSALELGLWGDPEDRAQLAEIIQSEGVLNQTNFPFRHKDGHEVRVHLSARLLKTAGGTLVLSCLEDITDLHRQREELQAKLESLSNDVQETQRSFRKVQSLYNEKVEQNRAIRSEFHETEARYTSLIENAADFVMFLDPEGFILQTNRTLPQHTKQQVIGVSITNFVPDARKHEAIHELIRHVCDTGEVVDYEGEGEGENGEPRMYVARVSPIRTPEGVVGVAAIIRDVTAEREAQRELQRHREEIGRLETSAAAGAMTSLILETIESPIRSVQETVRTCLQHIGAESDVTSLVARSLDQISVFAQHAGDVIRSFERYALQGEMNPERCKVEKIIHRAVDIVQDRALREGISLVSLPIRKTMPEATWDAIQIEQVLINLLTNAIEAVREQPDDRRSIRVTASFDAGTDVVAFGIRDHGCGLPRNFPKTFRPFHSGHGLGLGVGLAVADRIVTAHGGQLMVTDHRDGGVVCRVRLPLRSGTSVSLTNEESS